MPAKCSREIGLGEGDRLRQFLKGIILLRQLESDPGIERRNAFHPLVENGASICGRLLDLQANIGFGRIEPLCYFRLERSEVLSGLYRGILGKLRERRAKVFLANFQLRYYELAG